MFSGLGCHKKPFETLFMKEEEKIRDLVKRAQNGDNHAFAQIYEQYFTPIYRFIFFKVGDREEAEDLTQTVFLKTLKSLDGFRFKNKPFRAWLYRVAHNTVIDFFRQRKDLSLIGENPEDWQIEFADETLNPIEEAEELELARLARQAMQEMKELDRQVLIMRYLDDFSYQEIAKIVGKKEEAVRQISSRSVRGLKEFFRGKGLL